MLWCNLKWAVQKWLSANSNELKRCCKEEWVKFLHNRTRLKRSFGENHNFMLFLQDTESWLKPDLKSVKRSFLTSCLQGCGTKIAETSSNASPPVWTSFCNVCQALCDWSELCEHIVYVKWLQWANLWEQCLLLLLAGTVWNTATVILKIDKESQIKLRQIALNLCKEIGQFFVHTRQHGSVRLCRDTFLHSLF